MKEFFIKEALKEAEKAYKLGEVPVGAVVVLNNEIIGRGHNLCEQNNDPTAHAEILAIKSAAKNVGDFRLKDAELYVTLEPCPMCVGAAVNARIKEIIFGAYDKNKGALFSVANILSFPFPNRPDFFGGIKEKECKKLLTEFFKEKRK